MENNFNKLITCLDYIKYGEELLSKHNLYYGHGTSTAFDEAAYIVLTITGDIECVDDSVYAKKVSEQQRVRIEKSFTRRIKEKVPAAYILSEAWFFGLSFYVDNSVLVPRSPFAELISEQFNPWVIEGQTKKILDLCTGSGCIGIACATVFLDATVDLADISSAALNVANKNILRHNLTARVSTIESNLFNSIAAKQYDLIVSNPPYVGHQEFSTLPDEFYKEPRLGLDGGISGLDLVHQILAHSANYLNDGGVLYVEVGNTDVALQRCYPDVPFLWQEFEYGGHGIFMLTKEQLLEYNGLFQAKLS